MTFWDQQFSIDGFKYGTQPNAFLRAQASRLAPGSEVLLPGDGEGRNSVWLAQQGHRATALDQSTVGLAKAQALAAERGVSLHVLQADLAQWQAQPDSFDAVVSIYLHLPPALRAVAHQHLFNALRPGGWFVLEAFHPRQLGYQSGGPKDEAMLYTLEMLRADLALATRADRHEVLAWEGETQLDEGSGHQGPAFVTRLMVQRR